MRFEEDAQAAAERQSSNARAVALKRFIFRFLWRFSVRWMQGYCLDGVMERFGLASYLWGSRPQEQFLPLQPPAL
ncbi:hypothetical protein A8B84_19370 [Marinobacter sp. EhC06]|nr:hypothetical protein A8B80_16940 [Marinobacter sp. EhN04]OAN94265.1 hypothetical protein A8B84_19370 [Marinobacter sp. EhC06]